LGVRLGSFRVVETDSAGRALLSDASNVTSATTYRGEYRFDATIARNQTKLVIPDAFKATDLEVREGELRLPAQVAVQSLTVRDGAIAAASTPDLHLEVVGTLLIEQGGLLDASGQGYPGATSASSEGGSPDWVVGSIRDFGGSHGGPGTYQGYPTSQVGEVFGSVYLPQLPGGGGSYRYTQGGSGGGGLYLAVGNLQLDGVIRSSSPTQGLTSSVAGAAGAGGSILVVAQTLTGGGLIDASGGENQACSKWAGSGGGGRIALYVDDLTTFDPSTQTRSWGGAVRYCDGTLWSNRVAGAGTVYVETSETPGNLFVAQSGPPSTLATPLPVIGQGVVGTTTVDDQDETAFWIEALDPDFVFGPGVQGSWLRIEGVDYRIVAQRSDYRQVLLAEAEAIEEGDAFVGVYRFANVEVTGGAILVIDDLSEIGVSTVDEDSQLLLNGNP
ncbi:MAG: hypothetical protein K8J08_11350, partial [Thermoanaerobaculia bacterium]|nr:hypothetical protein [Thermoanaerobaculia bacterium]